MAGERARPHAGTPVIIVGPAGPLEVLIDGSGPAVVLLASLGRGASDFDQLARRLADSGYCAIRPQPRGIGGSGGTQSGVTMADLADDVAAVIGAMQSPATVVGHAFGNRVARMVATRHPDLVESVVLLAAGGLVPPAREIADALVAIFDPTISDVERLRLVGMAFFAPGNDPSVWADGWSAETAGIQRAATKGTAVEDWWEAGGSDVLVVQPADDVLAVPENAHRIVAAIGSRASMVTIPNAGHALLPEQPEAVATTLLSWLDSRTRP